MNKGSDLIMIFGKLKTMNKGSDLNLEPEDKL